MIAWWRMVFYLRSNQQRLTAAQARYRPPVCSTGSRAPWEAGRSDSRRPSISAGLQPRRRGVRGGPAPRGEAGPAARREKCFKLPIRNPDFPSEHLANQVFGLFGGSADAFDRFYQGRAVQAKRAETVGQS
jgi:hypothetical protein